MKKIISAMFVFCLSIMMFSGCGFSNLGVEGLLNAPKLSDEQSEIHKALIENVGKDIKLKYPISGDNRSAIVVANLDDEPTKEAIVFYQKANSLPTENSIRMKILDQIDGKWESVYESSANGTDVDKVVIRCLGSDNKISIIVGYCTLNQNEKSLQIYNYSNRVLDKIYSDTYSEIEEIGLNYGNKNELVTLTNSIGEKKAVAKILKRVDNNIIPGRNVAMSGNTASYSNIVKGKYNGNNPVLFVDCLKSDGTLQTEALIYQNNQLFNPFIQDTALMKTSRLPGYYSCDIDRDGIVEIPVTVPFIGNEISTNKKDIVMMTEWKVLNSNGELEKKYSSYYNINDSYVFTLPSTWLGFVTVKEEPDTNEVVFYKYDKKITDTELMRLTAQPHQKLEEYKKKGYIVIKPLGQIDYLVKFGSTKNEPLILTMAELADNFYVLSD